MLLLSTLRILICYYLFCCRRGKAVGFLSFFLVLRTWLCCCIVLSVCHSVSQLLIGRILSRWTSSVISRWPMPWTRLRNQRGEIFFSWCVFPVLWLTLYINIVFNGASNYVLGCVISADPLTDPPPLLIFSWVALPVELHGWKGSGWEKAECER